MLEIANATYKSEFFWGIVIGLLLATAGALIQAYINNRLSQKHLRDSVEIFCVDTINNIKNIISEMDKTRERTKVILDEFLTLIEVEIGIYGRNREHLIRIPEIQRAKMRNFMNDIALSHAKAKNSLNEFYRLRAEIGTLDIQNNKNAISERNNRADRMLSEAHASVDRMITLSKDSHQLINEIKDRSI